MVKQSDMPVIRKRQTVEIEKKLISEINALEQENLSHNINILDKNKLELENKRGETIRGHQSCSHIQWLGDGEKPTKYFCSLEHHNYTDKTIKKIIKHDRTILVDQKDILSEFKNF